MTVYVDALVDYGALVSPGARVYGTVWCHMMADSEDELRDFARRIGCREGWVQHPGTTRVHFDLTPLRRAQAVRLGAVELSVRELVRLCGLRAHVTDGPPPVTS